MHYNKIKKSFGLSSFKVLKGPNLIQPHRISSQAHSPLFIFFIYKHTIRLMVHILSTLQTGLTTHFSSSIMDWAEGPYFLLNRLRFMALIISLMFHLSQNGLPKKNFIPVQNGFLRKKKKPNYKLVNSFDQ